MPLEDLHAVLKVDAGKLELSPLKLGIASGSIDAQIMLDGRQDPIAVNATLDVSHARLAQLFPTVKIMRNSSGAIGAKIHVIGNGDSIASILADSKGTAQLAMSGGTVSDLMMEAIGLDGAQIARLLIEGDEQTPIRCAGASFNVDGGLATSDIIVFDTDNTRVDGKGNIDMKNEQFDILLTPQTETSQHPRPACPACACTAAFRQARLFAENGRSCPAQRRSGGAWHGQSLARTGAPHRNRPRHQHRLRGGIPCDLFGGAGWQDEVSEDGAKIIWRRAG